MLEEFCKELTNTYDTNIIDNQSDIVKEQILDLSLKNRNNTINIGKKVLMELICNHYSKKVKKPIAEFIGGPKTLTVHWHPIYKKIIYIFGEWHANNMDCTTFKKDAVTVPVEDYLYDLMLSTDVFLDIYIELYSYQGGEYLYEPYVPSRTHELFKKFRKCLQYNTRSDASCQLTRVHYFDIRHNNLDLIEMEEHKITILWFKEKIQDYILNEKNKAKCVSSLKSLLQKYPKISNLLRELLQDDIEKVCEFMKKQLAEETYIKKNLDKIKENPELKTQILTFYGNIICKKIKKLNLKKYILNILNYNEESDDVLFVSMNSLKILLSRALTCFADVYLLARMFKDFDMSEMEKKAYKGATDQPSRANNIIIYCGNVHAKNYRRFLESIGFNEIDRSGDLTEKILNPKLNTPKNCLDMSQIKQPLFSYKRYGPIPEDCTKNTLWKMDKWKMDKYLAGGEQATVFSSPTTDHEGYYTYVVKSQVANINFFKEVKALKELKDTKRVVEMFDAWICDTSGYIAMEYVRPFGYNSTHGITQVTLWKEVGIILSLLSERGWLQIDVHAQNVAMKKDGKIVLIDFGFAVKKTEGVGQTYPEHLYSITYPDITWEQLKILQDFNYQKAFNPQTTDEQKAIFQEAKDKWESQKFGKVTPGKRSEYYKNLKRALTFKI